MNSSLNLRHKKIANPRPIAWVLTWIFLVATLSPTMILHYPLWLVNGKGLMDEPSRGRRYSYNQGAVPILLGIGILVALGLLASWFIALIVFIAQVVVLLLSVLYVFSKLR